MITGTLLKTVSIGRVARDIIEDDLYIDVFPIELQPGVDGELTTETTHTNNVQDSEGLIDVVSVTQTNLIKAIWLPDGDTNRLEPPTVCKGEIVRLYRYSDTDIYYWQTLYNQLDLRKLEKRTIVVSNKSSINVPKEDLLEHSYYCQMDTINKLVHLHTSTTDGEYTTYDITIDTKEGMLEITDGKGNRIFLESQDDRLTIETNKELIRNTTDETINIRNNKLSNIGNRYDINLKSYSVDNGQHELIALLMEFVQTCSDALGDGNHGSPVPVSGGSKGAYAALKGKFQTFK